MPEREIPIVVPWPVRGVHRGEPLTEQPRDTCPDARNVRTLHTLQRAGGGKRDGIVRAFSSELKNGDGTVGRINALAALRVDVAPVEGALGPGPNPTTWVELSTGLDDTGVRLAAFSPLSTVNILGNFTTAGGAAAERFARWDDVLGAFTNPTPSFDTNPSDPAGFLVYDDGTGNGNQLYCVGGRRAGVPNLFWFARWDAGTQSWEDLVGSATGITSINAIALWDDGTNGPRIVIGGDFSALAGTSADNLAVWNGAVGDFTELGGGTDDVVNALHVWSVTNELFLGGGFTTAGSIAAPRLARFDGSNMRPLSGGVTGGEVLALSEYDSGSNTRVYAGGLFTASSGNGDHQFVTSWDGTNLLPLVKGLDSEYAASVGGVTCFQVFDDGGGDRLWMAGYFEQASTLDGQGVACPNIAIWDGSNFDAPTVGCGSRQAEIKHMVRAGTSTLSHLFVTGSFIRRNFKASYGFAAYDGDELRPFGNGGVANMQGGDPNALHVADIGDGTRLYVGIHAGSAQFGRGPGAVEGALAQWNGNRWEAVGSAVINSHVNALHKFSDPSRGDELIMAGSFTSPGSRIQAIDDDGTIYTLGDGLGDRANTLEEWDDPVSGLTTMYVGGEFITAGGSSALRIAAWKGSGLGWATLGTGLNGECRVILAFGSVLVAAGDFTDAGGTSANRIAQWDGSAWSAMGDGFDDTVWGLALHGGELYACGDFLNSGATSVTRIARWTGAAWAAVGSGINDTGKAMLSSSVDGTSKLYVVGKFTQAGGVDAMGIAAWTGGGYQALSTDDYAGLWDWNATNAAPDVQAITELSGSLIVTGEFQGIGGVESNYFAKGQAAA